MRPPTDAQIGRLRVLARGGTVCSPGKRDWAPLLRRGLVEPDPTFPPKGDDMPWLRITPAGYRALADHLEQHGHPEHKKHTDAQEGTDAPR
jgi:hypothetical protein